MTGRGVRTWADGRVYEGEFLQGEMHGKGFWRNSSTNESYEGEFRDNKRQGYGHLQTIVTVKTVVPVDSPTAVASNSNNEAATDALTSTEGKSSVEVPDGQEIEAEVVTKTKVVETDYNISYQGQFLQHKFHGCGTFLYANSFIVHGEFANGKLCGRNHINWRKLAVMDGLFEDGIATSSLNVLVELDDTNLKQKKNHRKCFFAAMDNGYSYYGEFAANYPYIEQCGSSIYATVDRKFIEDDEANNKTKKKKAPAKKGKNDKSVEPLFSLSPGDRVGHVDIRILGGKDPLKIPPLPVEDVNEKDKKNKKKKDPSVTEVVEVVPDKFPLFCEYKRRVLVELRKVLTEEVAEGEELQLGESFPVWVRIPSIEAFASSCERFSPSASVAIANNNSDSATSFRPLWPDFYKHFKPTPPLVPVDSKSAIKASTASLNKSEVEAPKEVQTEHFPIFPTPEFTFVSIPNFLMSIAPATLEDGAIGDVDTAIEVTKGRPIDVLLTVGEDGMLSYPLGMDTVASIKLTDSHKLSSIRLPEVMDLIDPLIDRKTVSFVADFFVDGAVLMKAFIKSQQDPNSLSASASFINMNNSISNVDILSNSMDNGEFTPGGNDNVTVAETTAGRTAKRGLNTNMEVTTLTITKHSPYFEQDQVIYELVLVVPPINAKNYVKTMKNKRKKIENNNPASPSHSYRRTSDMSAMEPADGKYPGEHLWESCFWELRCKATTTSVEIVPETVIEIVTIPNGVDAGEKGTSADTKQDGTVDLEETVERTMEIKKVVNKKVFHTNTKGVVLAQWSHACVFDCTQWHCAALTLIPNYSQAEVAKNQNNSLGGESMGYYSNEASLDKTQANDILSKDRDNKEKSLKLSVKPELLVDGSGKPSNDMGIVNIMSGIPDEEKQSQSHKDSLLSQFFVEYFPKDLIVDNSVDLSTNEDNIGEQAIDVEEEVEKEPEEVTSIATTIAFGGGIFQGKVKTLAACCG